MMMERSASRAEPPALRTMWAEPRGMPNAEGGSMRASMQVTGGGKGGMGLEGFEGNEGKGGGDLPTRYFFEGGRGREPWLKTAA